uniref:Uncharacterized protein LOC117367356 n=1 Tax=Geotrypetes seraphini TaxID=260995 RepID=A0A6P8SAU7_GEOSA|nr:uncharacterized protein LOC117367356 [Geotrypetes seraphini]XP_033815691.1 uncharacterized protein LOC117367356 [Geotrypetes seraphini]XP_033815692.1 uncharacterized protein LOC117367356 [Geotrypetes seraphini]XP_033815693.1 uncharacterized protein LOC117367356 [Geotrypetes seraphini]
MVFCFLEVSGARLSTEQRDLSSHCTSGLKLHSKSESLFLLPATDGNPLLDLAMGFPHTTDVLLLAILILCVWSHKTQKPLFIIYMDDTEVFGVINRSAVLSCSTNEGDNYSTYNVLWRHKNVTIYSSTRDSNALAIPPGKYHLLAPKSSNYSIQINDLDISDEGIYTCFVQRGGKQKSILLKVEAQEKQSDGNSHKYMPLSDGNSHKYMPVLLAMFVTVGCLLSGIS